eukprot:m51a1_g1390 hypothetical protein (357) ;mRNA; f:470176-474134
MDSPHSRLVPTTKHTLDDLVFAAFQGPVLGLSSRVLHQYRSFTALLLLRTRWRTDRGLSQADVAAALVHARCCVPGTLVAAECSKCGSVLDVSENEPEQQRLRRELPGGIELYAATVRTLCTSSRKHVGSAMLVLAAELAPGAVVVSDRFAIYARQAARHVARRGSSSSSSSSSSVAPDGAAEASQQLEVGQWRPAAEQRGSPGEEEFVVAAGALLARSPLGPELRALGPAGMVIAVRINAVTITQEEQQLIASGLVPVLRSNVPGFLLQKTSMTSAIVVIVGGFSSPDGLLLATRFGWQFISNQIRNPLNRNLIADGLAPFEYSRSEAHEDEAELGFDQVHRCVIMLPRFYDITF